MNTEKTLKTDDTDVIEGFCGDTWVGGDPMILHIKKGFY